MSVARYPSYKESGVGWLAEVPSHWSLEKFRHRFRESSEKIEAEVVGPMLSVSGYRGIEIKAYDDENRRRTDEDLIGYRIVRKGQLVVNTMWLNYAGLGISEYEGHVSPAYRSYWPSQTLNLRFVHYILRSSAYVMGYTQLITGVRPNSLQMSRDDLMNFPVLLPPRSEQASITAFLDRETAKIDALVEEQQRLIALLKEKRQAVISHAVTKGLDPSASMKDSGVKWLGEVPRHWLLTPLKRSLDILSGFAFPSVGFSADPSKTRLLRGVNVGVGELRWEDVVYWERINDDGLSPWELRCGDVVLGMDRPWIADGFRTAQLSNADLPCLLLQRVVALRPADWLMPEYVQRLLAGELFYHHCVPEMTGVSVPHISPGQIGEFVVPLPPLEEQRAILKRLVECESRIGSLSTAAETAIILLQERRAALISAAVTGKIDVRGLAPAEAEAA